MRAITTQFLERNNDMLYLQKKFFNYMMLSFSERFGLSSSHLQRVMQNDTHLHIRISAEIIPTTNMWIHNGNYVPRRIS